MSALEQQEKKQKTKNRSSSDLLAALSLILVGILNIVIVIYLIASTGEDRTSMEAFLEGYTTDPLPLSAAWIVFSITGFLSYLIIPKVSEMVKWKDLNIKKSAELFGIVGFSVLGLWAITLLRRTPDIAAAYVAGDSNVKAAILAQGLPEIDPDGWFGFGGLGLWFIIVNINNLSSKSSGKVYAWFGILAGLSAWSTVFGAALNIEILHLIASAGGATFMPSWYIWTGVRLLRK